MRATGSSLSTSPRLHQQSLPSQPTPGSRLAKVATQRRFLEILRPSPSQLCLWERSSNTSQRTIRNASSSAVSGRILVHGVGSNKKNPLGMEFQFRRGSDHECRDEAKAILGYSSSPWFTRLRYLLTAFWTLSKKFMAASPPCSGRWFFSSSVVSSFPSHRSFRRRFIAYIFLVYDEPSGGQSGSWLRSTFISSGVAGAHRC